MGKRSSFERVERDFYPTPYSAVAPLIPHLDDCKTYCEPCAGDGALIRHLEPIWCLHESDIEPASSKIEKQDAFTLGAEHVRHCDAIITNPPWARAVLHPMIEHFRKLRDTWLLFDADWMHTKQASELIKSCAKIVSVGRVKWIPGSKHTGKDNCCWYLFKDLWNDGPRFVGR